MVLSAIDFKRNYIFWNQMVQCRIPATIMRFSQPTTTIRLSSPTKGAFLMTISTVGIIGAGTMGNGIAQACAVSGIDVVMVDIADAAVQKGIATVAGSLERLVKKEKITPADKAAALARIKGSTRYEDLKAGQIVIEAATENYEIKLKILKQVDALVAPEVIIASNTSSISITKLAAATSRADKFIGMHFFNPVPMMALVEIIRGLSTSDATHDAVEQLAKRLGKSPITVKNSPGFVVNRILVPMINEAFFVLAEGLTSPEDIDAGMKLGCNQPIGPLALADLVGLDVCLAVMEVYLTEFGDSQYRPCPLLKEMVAAGRLGRKTKRGVYQY
jgi:3-hydroxybutyryl-CoA dehydrogenase